MELGESIAVSLFVDSNDEHSAKTCPWHSNKKASPKSMDAQDGDEDAAGEMADNSGKKLGQALTQDGTPAPDGQTVSIYYQQGAIVKYPSGRKTKTIQLYEEKIEEEEYPLKYAPHHLIPGNESLKGSDIVAFLGDESVIANFKKQGSPSSELKDGESAGYDVNCAANGEWLPSPYALSMNNEWPAAEGISALRKREDLSIEDTLIETEAFKLAYAAAAMARGVKQFHMRHAEYSAKVREILDAMAAKIQLLAWVCPKTKSDADNGDKYNAPVGLSTRLDGLSQRLRRLLNGRPGGWRNPLFTDDLSRQYLQGYKGRPRKQIDLKVM